MQWFDAVELGLDGQGWRDGLAHPYDRLPARAEVVAPEPVWRLGRQSVGLSVRFHTDADAIHARMVLRVPGEPQFHYRKYLDLYARDADGAWRWAGVSRYGIVPSGQTPLLEGVDPVAREYCVYLPPFFQVERLAIGVPDGASLTLARPPAAKPVVIYGTSIVHGASASRPGMVFPSILGRRLKVPVVNLGFSGSARMEPDLAPLFAEIDAAAYIIDPLANMSPDLVEAHALPFLERLLAARPETPVLLVEDRVHCNAWLRADGMTRREAKWAAFRQVYDELKTAGASALAYQAGAPLFGNDSELTVDGSHPSDLGCRRLADVCEPHWQSLLEWAPARG